MYYFVVNPAAKAGHGMEVWEQARRVLDERGVPYRLFCSTEKGDVTRLVNTVTTTYTADEPDGLLRLVIVGGDGTLNEAMQGVADFDKLLLGYIPAGSANDFAVNAGISKHPVEALEQILGCTQPVKYDLGYMTYDDAEDAAKRHYFSSSCGMGYDAAVSLAAADPSASGKGLLDKLGMGSMIFLLMAIKTLFKLERGDCTMTLDDNEVVELPNFLLICSMIYRYEGGGFLFSPDADPCDGKLDICAFGKIPKWKVLIALPSAYKGTHYKYKDVTPYRAGKVQLRASMPFWIQLDGEVSVKSSNITIVCDQTRLRLLK